MFRYILMIMIYAVSADVLPSKSTAIDPVEAVLKKAGVKKNNASVVFYDINNKKIKYALNENKFFSIASVNKLFVTGAALKYLGQGFRFKTSVIGTLPDANGTVKGNIYIKGGGDPVFVSESMWYLVNRLVDLGIKKIDGDIILDDTAFPASTVYEESNDRAYSSQISSLSVNFNSIALSITAGKQPNVTLDPAVSGINFVNKTKYTNKETDVQMKRTDSDIMATGNINNSEYLNKFIYRNVDDTVRYFSDVLKLHLQWRGVMFSGSIKRGEAPKNQLALFDMESRRLSDILMEMNKFSNNFIAEQLLRAMAPADKAVGMVKDYLVGIGLDKSSFEITDASGFSRTNRIQPIAMVKFLDHMYGDFETGPEFINSLSISGVDGTIRRSLKSKTLTGRVRAKTGTLDGIRSLAGYLKADNTVYAFIIVANDVNAHKLLDWEGKILDNFVSN